MVMGPGALKALGGRREALDMLIAVAAEIDGLPAGDKHLVMATPGCHDAAQELAVFDAPLLDVLNGCHAFRLSWRHDTKHGGIVQRCSCSNSDENGMRRVWNQRVEQVRLSFGTIRFVV